MRVRRRWRPPDVSRSRELIAIGLNVVPAVVGLTALLFFSAPSDWSSPALIGALCGVAAVAYAAEARLKLANPVFFGATLIIAVVTLAVAGPIPAFCVWLVPDLIARFVLRSEQRIGPGFVANVSSYAIAVVVGGWLLELAGSPSGAEMAPALYAAGVAMSVLNFAFARLAFAPFYQGYRPAKLIRDEFVDIEPSVLGMLLLGVAAAVMVDDLGVLALAPLAAVIVVPQVALERITHSESAANLVRADAMRLYTAAIADVLGVSRSERRELACASDLIQSADNPIAARGLDWRDADVSRVAFLALHSHELWSGAGWPAGLPAEAIPRGSRILAVAGAWADLTAAGTPELSQTEAILSLAAQAGSAFDPAIVDAAARVVEDEQAFSDEPAFQPKLHRLPAPRALRREALPALLPRLVGSSA
jgi:HD domain